VNGVRIAGSTPVTAGLLTSALYPTIPPTVAPITVEELLARARARLHRLGPAEAAEAQAGGALLVDTRSEDDRRREGVIPGSLHVPLSVLPWRAELLGSPEGELVVVCNDGYSSSLAAALLQELGFERATDLAGGFRAWAAAGLPVD
jgi:rhodanese-related sulfurtransferase